MTANNPEVAAYRYTASRSFGKRNPKWHYQESFPNAENRKVEEIGRLEKLIRLSDYETRMAVLFDGYAVYSAMTDKAKQHTSYESVAAALDAVVKLMREVKHDNQ